MTSQTRYRLIMMAPLLVVLLNAWLAFHSLGRFFDAQRWLNHTLEVLTQAEETQLAVSSANSAARAYLLTGSALYQARYNEAKKAVHGDVDTLQALTGDNASQQARVAFLRTRIAARFRAVDAVIDLRQKQGMNGLSAAALRPALNDSPDGGIGARYVFIDIQDEERRLLQDRYAEASAGRRFVIFTFAGATVLDVLLVILAFQQFINAVRDREKLAERAGQIEGLNAELSTLNADLERRVEQRTRELEVSNQELQAFSYSVSHDLRAPLRTIDGFSLALAEDFSDTLNEEGRDYIQRVRAGVQRMGLLIDALLQLSRVTRSEIQRERVDLSEMAQGIFTDLMGNEKGRAVQFTAQPHLVADADPKLMRVAFENLIGNALKFTSKRPDACVEFGALAKSGKTVYFIRDNGAGFDMQYVDRLFTAFQRLHGDRDFKGSGIGLATVSRIIRRHHGTIWAEAAVSQGATFFFTLEG